jgi:hypothetical protein
VTDDAAYSDIRLEPGNRGREADRPGELPARGWKDVVVRLKAQLKEGDIPCWRPGWRSSPCSPSSRRWWQ